MKRRRSKKVKLGTIYPYNKEQNSHIVEVWLNQYEDVFNEWDPAPFRRRDLDPELVVFMQEASTDIPIKFGLQLRFFLPGELRDKNKEFRIAQGIHYFFRVTQHLIERDLLGLQKKIFTFIMLGVVCLSGAFSLREASIHFLMELALEGLFIGGWVFIWEALSLFLFEVQEKTVEIKRCRRFVDAEVEFVNEEEKPVLVQTRADEVDF